jgi:leucyl aminopeptidase
MKCTFSNKSPKDKEVASIVFVVGDDAVVRTSDKRTVLEIGIGKREEMTRRKLITTVRKMVTAAKTAKKKEIAFEFTDLVFPLLHIDANDLAELIATNLEMANFEFVTYKTKPKEGWNMLTNVTVIGKLDAEVEKGFKKGKLIGEGVNGTRTLANTPGGDMTPSKLADAAFEMAAGLPIAVTVIDEAGMEALGMGAILGVGKGSDDKPKFIIMEYMMGGEKEKPIVLVGKGITFDTGGLNLKPTNFIYEMHMDMSGGAAVMHAVVVAAKLKLKKNIVALVPAAENMPSGSSYRPGDVLTSMSGKTIEVMNTDAEGRVVLADALTYAEQYKPRLVVDVATLTGAAEVALGQHASAIFSKEQHLEDEFRKLGEASGDYVWPLPLWDEYESDIKGTFGDWANDGKSKYGGAIQGAMFLYQFAKNYPWVHIDMAPRMVSIDGDHLAKGAAGAPVRLLIKLLEQY